MLRMSLGSTLFPAMKDVLEPPWYMDDEMSASSSSSSMILWIRDLFDSSSSSSAVSSSDAAMPTNGQINTFSTESPETKNDLYANDSTVDLPPENRVLDSALCPPLAIINIPTRHKRKLEAVAQPSKSRMHETDAIDAGKKFRGMRGKLWQQQRPIVTRKADNRSQSHYLSRKSQRNWHPQTLGHPGVPPRVPNHFSTRDSNYEITAMGIDQQTVRINPLEAQFPLDHSGWNESCIYDCLQTSHPLKSGVVRESPKAGLADSAINSQNQSHEKHQLAEDHALSATLRASSVGQIHANIDVSSLRGQAWPLQRDSMQASSLAQVMHCGFIPTNLPVNQLTEDRLNDDNSDNNDCTKKKHPIFVNNTLQDCQHLPANLEFKATGQPSFKANGQHALKATGHHFLEATDKVSDKPRTPSVEEQESQSESSSQSSHHKTDSTQEVITEPREQDILLGRGSSRFMHPANQRLRFIVDEYRELYENSFTRAEKTGLTEVVVQLAKTTDRTINGEQEPLGRFLEFRRDLQGWVEIDDDRARQKVSHLFRGKMLARDDSDR